MTTSQLCLILSLTLWPLLTEQGKLPAANQGVKEAIGLDPAELVGKSFLEVDFLDQENKIILAKSTM